MFGALEANLRRMGIGVREIGYGLATHYHIDHAGAAQDLKNHGMQLIVTDEQGPFIVQMKQHIKPSDHYTEIALHDNRRVSCAESRSFLASLGIPGEIVATPGHSDDSVSLLLDTGEAFTGDLTLPMMATEESAAQVAGSWSLLRTRGARQMYGGHGPVRPIPVEG